MVAFVMVSVAIQCMNLLNHYTALAMATSDPYASAFGPTRDAQTMLFADRALDGFFIAQIFFGAWLVPLGYLVIKSGFFPKALGVALMIACGAYLVDTIAYFTTRDFQETFVKVAGPFEALAELAMIGWLLFKAIPSDEERDTTTSRQVEPRELAEAMRATPSG